MTTDEYLDRRFDDIDLPESTRHAREASRTISIEGLQHLEELVGRRKERPGPEPKPVRRDEEPENDAIPLGQ